VISSDLLVASASQTLSSVIRLDASLADSYNTTGYIESMSIRGFLLNQSGNYSRNGLTTSNDAPIALENKERIEVLKGVAGLRSGVSAPGGLVNYVTKVPMKDNFFTAALSANDSGGAKLHLDVNQKLGAIGVRLNLVDETLRPQYDKADGTRQFLSLALANELSPATSVSANLEYHRKRQPSVPGLGLLDVNGDGAGDTLPRGVGPLLNLNNQAWSQPFEASSRTAEVVLDHRLNADWRARVAINTQRLDIDDRLAFPDGCSRAGVYPGLCANGDVDIYDYRNEGERRNLWSWDARLDGKFKAFGLQHATRLGLNGRSASADLAPMQTYNLIVDEFGNAIANNIYAPVALPASPKPGDPNTDSRERALAAYASLTSDLSQNVQSFVGVRSTRLKRSSELSDGTLAVSYEQTVITPWAGLAWSPIATTTLYASWGQGVELEVVPNNPLQFTNSGQVLPALKSEQTEIGLKWQANPRLLLTAAAFSIDKPSNEKVDPYALSPLAAGAKTARHRGLELSAAGRVNSALSLQASLMALDAKYTQAVDQTLVGRRVTNLPRLKASLFADYKLAALPGLSLNGLATFENGKTVTTDGSVELASAWQLDAGLSYQQRTAGKTTLWRFNIENLTNRTYWREAPTASWGGVYLFPAAPRTLRASVTVDF
jgi:iron complex outermembrane receptor protein